MQPGQDAVLDPAGGRLVPKNQVVVGTTRKVPEAIVQIVVPNLVAETIIDLDLMAIGEVPLDASDPGVRRIVEGEVRPVAGVVRTWRTLGSVRAKAKWLS
jgi:hypothetical protein